jgi:DNA (cytosine-5)-methyltransferase 1
MVQTGKDKFILAPGFESSYRRLSVRECARIQTFPDSYVFKTNNSTTAYKMVGNAVPVRLAEHIATQIKADLTDVV